MKGTRTKYPIRLNRKNEFSWAWIIIALYILIPTIFICINARHLFNTPTKATIMIVMLLWANTITWLTGFLHQGLEVMKEK
jgi:hypothetical protein